MIHMNTLLSATSDEVTEKLRDAIISGEYIPGERLIEDELAAKYCTSRTPIREAIRNLSSVGLIKIEPYKGTYVADVNSEEIKEIYSVRVNLEGLATKLATPYIPEEVFSDLSSLIDVMDKSIEEGDRQEFAKSNVQFHITIYSYCQNKILISLIQDLMNRSVLFRRSSWESGRHLKTVMNSHKELLVALMERNPEKAQQIIEKHTQLFISKI